MDKSNMAELDLVLNSYFDAREELAEKTLLRDTEKYISNGGSVFDQASSKVSLFEVAIDDGLVKVLDWMFSSKDIGAQFSPQETEKIFKRAISSDIDGAVQDLKPLTFSATKCLVDNGLNIEKAESSAFNVRAFVGGFGEKILSEFDLIFR